MKQNTFGKRLATAPKWAQAAAWSDERVRLGVLIVTGIVTGFVAAAIECL